jgi:hypothetical protein
MHRRLRGRMGGHAKRAIRMNTPRSVGMIQLGAGHKQHQQNAANAQQTLPARPLPGQSGAPIPAILQHITKFSALSIERRQAPPHRRKPKTPPSRKLFPRPRRSNYSGTSLASLAREPVRRRPRPSASRRRLNPLTRILAQSPESLPLQSGLCAPYSLFSIPSFSAILGSAHPARPIQSHKIR